MRIAIDTSPTQSGHKTRGVGKYTQLLIEALKKSKTNLSFYFFTRGEKLPKNIDLVHYPYFDPFFLTQSIVRSIPYVITVHDLIPLVYPEKFPRGIRGEIKWQIQKNFLKGARRVITDSEASKKDIEKIVNLLSDHIDVIHLASAPIFKQIVEAKKLIQIKKKFNLPSKFLLYVGDVNWNKNIEGLLESFRQVLDGYPDVLLVLVGKAFFDTSLSEIQVINEHIKRLQIDRSIMKLGFVPDKDLVGLYSLAAVYVQPSFAEGFGFPVLEAMSCGCPVVTSKESSLGEIVGPAEKVDPKNPEDIAKGIQRVLQSNRQSLSKKGIAWAKHFSWEKVAQKTISVYEKALA